MAAAASLDFGKFKFLTIGYTHQVRTASTCQILSKSLKNAAEIWRFFKMAVVRHLGFSKVGNFNFRTHSEAQYASPYQISRRSVKRFRRYGRFSIFQMAFAAILDFGNFEFLTVGTLKRVELRLHAKFWRNRSKRG